MKYYYLGAFPPPYGGVTVKNQLLFDELKEFGLPIAEVDFSKVKKFSIRELYKFWKAILCRKTAVVIGVGNLRLRRSITKYLYLFFRQKMRRSVLVVMGGLTAKYATNDKEYQRWLSGYKKIYVETQGMKNDFEGFGLKNVSLFPNCRKRPQGWKPTISYNKKVIRALFFSLVSREKGVDTILDTIELLNKYNNKFFLDFYGHIENEYSEEFFSRMKNHENVKYCGVFQKGKDEVYKLLNGYDILLLPTKWLAEGVPGVLVESKIAALPAIVSDICYNVEIVKDGLSGIVLKSNNAHELAIEIENLIKEPQRLIDLKENALNSANEYYIETYIAEIVNTLLEDN